MDKDTNNRLQVELHVPSFEKVLDFYGKLGFKKIWHKSEDTNPEYLVMERSGVIINFWPGNDKVYKHSYFKQYPNNTKRGYGVELIISVDGIEEYYERAGKFARVVSPLIKRPWGDITRV